MDSAVTPETDANINNAFYFKIEHDMSYPPAVKKKTTIVKYTRLPDFDSNSKVCQQASKPRLRRIIELDDPKVETGRSLQFNALAASKINQPSKRKTVSISENEENILTSNIDLSSRCIIKSSGTASRYDKNAVQRGNSRQSSSTKYCREGSRDARSLGKLSANSSNTTASRREQILSKPTPRSNYTSQVCLKSRSTKDREISKNLRNMPNSPKINLNSHIVPCEDGKGPPSIKNNSHINATSTAAKRIIEYNRMRAKSYKNKNDLLTEIPTRKPTPVIHVPLDKYSRVTQYETHDESPKVATARLPQLVDCGTNPEVLTDTNIKIAPQPTMFNEEIEPLDNTTLLMEETKDAFENLDIPNVTLQDNTVKDNTIKDSTVKDNTVKVNTVNDSTIKESTIINNIIKDNTIRDTTVKDIIIKDNTINNNTIKDNTIEDSTIKEKSNFAKREIVSFCSRSLPNLQAPSFQFIPDKNCDPIALTKSKTYIIGRATFTYTTQQKINFHVVGSSDDNQSNQLPSPLAYPLSMVSLFKNNYLKCGDSDNSDKGLPNEKDKPNTSNNKVDKLQALTHSHVFNNDKLVKPSKIINTIIDNNGLLHNEYTCEQFQRELHFIDSFYETLQYLESCSLSEKCLSEATSTNWVSKTGFDLNNSEYSSFLSKLESGAGSFAHIDDIETMASKSLCLLNLLIRDEQRRAKNLLFVLKMREDALKDFTKSQIIWLENKKKQDNTDVSTLKKKQRGALLKLQHECGEMQRMRKALLTLSEKRKAALMKTRNNIELKLNSNVDVEQILLGKKKLKRNLAVDRNVAPLKCFDLSSSGCEEYTSTKTKLEIPVASQELSSANSCAEKCVQTPAWTHSVIEPIVLVDRITDTAAENFIGVDGKYLNILFQNLSLPQIFSSDKQYEVNEDALKNVVDSSNKLHTNDYCYSDIIEKTMDKNRSSDSDRSSSLSTAHSLLDELDQYYKALSEGSKSSFEAEAENQNNTLPQMQVKEYSDKCVSIYNIEVEQSDKQCEVNAESILSGRVEPELSSLVCKQSSVSEDSACGLEVATLKCIESSVQTNPTGPLPVPPGATSPEPATSDSSNSASLSSISSGSRSDADESSNSAMSSLSQGQSEAEELRLQQLAIEREIKALEQQQSQLLAVREIPDKPPPPYTPPNNSTPKKSRLFTFTVDDEIKVIDKFTKGVEISSDITDPFSIFIKDVCEESLWKQQMEISDDPWEACNLMPDKQEQSPEKRARKSMDDIKQILSRVSPPLVSGVGSRRSDHIDDILFTEWRRCEPEWTTLQSDEVVVKSKIFESLFQKVLSDTIDQYKKTVVGLITPDTRINSLVNKQNKQSKLES